MGIGGEDEEDIMGIGGGDDQAGLLDDLGAAFMGGDEWLGIGDAQELLEAGLLDDLGAAPMGGAEWLGIEDIQELLGAGMLPMALDEEWATELGGGAFELMLFPEFTNGTLGSQPGTRSSAAG